MATKPDVVIAGAGPAGTTACYLIARLGFRVVTLSWSCISSVTTTELTSSGLPRTPVFICTLRRPARRGLNLVERWFALITQQAIRRGSFDSAHRLEQAIIRWLAYWNQHAKLFRWTRSAADIKRSLASTTAIYETQH